MSILIKKVRLNGELVDVLIKGNRFDSIGTDVDSSADVVIDGSGKAILPSFHNAHTHAAMTLMRGYADDMDLHTWLAEHIWPFEARLGEDDIYWGAKLACLEMIKSGTTFFADMYWHWKGTARAVTEMGMRAALSAAFFDFDDPARAETMKRQVMDLHAASAAFPDRIQFILGPHAIYTVSSESLRWLGEYATRHGLLVHLHLSETQKEVEDCLTRHGKRPVEYLHELGLLAPNLILAHAVWMDGTEMELLARHGVQVVHCPVSNMKLCSGQFNHADMKAHGVTVALGTDGCCSNNNLDMIEEMKIASLLAKVTSMDPTALPAQEALDTATLNGARMYGLDAGRIASGKLADCILVNLEHVRMVPGHHLVSNLVYSANSSCVDTTICDGRVLMLGGKVEGEEEILAQVRATLARLNAPRESEGRRMLLIYTGNGKGKTSACVGQAIRALGQGFSVAFGQFMKRGDQAGEQEMLAKLLGENFLASGAGFYRNTDYDSHREKAVQLLLWAGARLDRGVDMLILDETLYALNHGLLLEDEVRELIRRCEDQNCHLVLSGRGAPAWMVELADIVSDITEVRHVYSEGGKARRGIEF